MADEVQRFKVKITVEIEAGAAEDIGDMIDNAVECIKFGSASGSGSLLGGKGSYTYQVEDNLPRKPMTSDTVFEMLNEHREPGTPTVETIIELTIEGGEEAADWWQGLGEQGRYQWLTTYDGISTPLQAWKKYSGK